MSGQRSCLFQPATASFITQWRKLTRLSLLRAGLLSGLAALGLAIFCGCMAPPHASPPVPVALSHGFPHTLTASQGDPSIALPTKPQRIVSLAPAITEILYSVGAGDAILRDTPSCDYPPEAKRKPHFDPLTGSLESVLLLHPDLVIGQTHLTDRMLGLCRKAGLPTLAIDAPDFARTYLSIRRIGQATGTESSANAVADRLKARIEALGLALKAVKQRPRVLMLYGTNPIYTTGPGSFIDAAIALAGGRNIVDQPLPGDRLSSEQVLLRQPEVIVCGKEEQTKAEQMPGWLAGVPAVRAKRFFIPDAALERPCPRLADALARLARFLHPEIMLR